LLTILAVGEDTGLLKTRAEVLRKTGANVLCCSGAAALKYITEWEFDLIVLGHTVRQQDADKISEAAHRNGAKTLVLLLIGDKVREGEYKSVNIDAKSFAEPGCLVRSATELLARRVERRPLPVPSVKPIASHLLGKKPASQPAEIAARQSLKASFERRRAG
jgi:DNA-binding NtrC family response regulator